MANSKNAKVKLNLRNFSIDEKLNFTKHLHSTISGNPATQDG
jgi:hypothetical protein